MNNKAATEAKLSRGGRPLARARSRPLRSSLLLLVGALIPPLVLILAVAWHGRNVPYWDEWEMVPLLEKLVRGEFGFGDLWVQHNEHRHIFAWIVMLLLMRWSDWNIFYELYANVAIAMLSFFFLWRLIRETTAKADPGLATWLVLPASLFSFSLIQYENWASGFQMPLFMNQLGAVIVAWGLARWPGGWRGLAVACGGALLAVFSFASGIGLLLLIPVAVLLQGGPRKVLLLILSLAAGAIIAGFYFGGYRLPGNPRGFLNLWFDPLAYIEFVLAYLGAPLSARNGALSIAFGLLGLLSLIGSAHWLWRSAPMVRPLVTPWALLAAYALMSAMVTGMGRGESGVKGAMASRYTTLSSLFWIATSAVTALAFTLHRSRRRSSGAGNLLPGASMAALAIAIALGYLSSYNFGWYRFEARGRQLSRGGECLLAYRNASDACLGELYPDPAELRRRAKILESLEVGPFARKSAQAR